MIEHTITLSCNTPTQNDVILVTPPDINIKGSARVYFDMYGCDETAYPINVIIIDWGDGSPIEKYSKDLIKNYQTSSIFDEMIYGKIGGSISTEYQHIYKYREDAGFDNTVYRFNVTVYYENAYSIVFEGTIALYRGSFYDSVGGLHISTTQITPTEDNNTILNLEAVNNAYTFIGVLSS